MSRIHRDGLRAAVGIGHVVIDLHNLVPGRWEARTLETTGGTASADSTAARSNETVSDFMAGWE
ncbi:MAG: hypothetical protein NTW21_37945 [Verrucomicrobia bacterium]|nr:hypothetical protein [Verrucomicrobiota bacterium]